MKKEITFSYFGKWMGLFRSEDGLDSSFIFEIDGPNAENAKVYFITGQERFEGRKRNLMKDSLFILPENRHANSFRSRKRKCCSFYKDE